MHRRRTVCAFLVLATLVSGVGAGASRVSAADSKEKAFVAQYCTACHSDKLKTGGLSLEGLDPKDPGTKGAIWEKVLVKLRAGEMPPANRKPRPDAGEVRKFLKTLEESLDRAAAAAPNPGRPIIHRLNRAEYQNAVRDLVAVDVDTSTLLPADDSGYGFDNIADVLSMSPALFERYMAVAETVARLAVGERALATQSRAKVLLCQPPAVPGEICARVVLENLARNAYRRPVTAEDIAPLMALYRSRAGGDAANSSFDRGIQLALQALLVSPNFLFRIERDPAGGADNVRISDIDLASRLSFFIWSSIPDGVLLDLAEKKQLSEPAILEQQIRRMLADSRSSALTENFAGQWLYLRNLSLIKPDPELFPAFDDELRLSLRRETELFFAAILKDNRSIVDILTADFTFINERLARHYGVPGIKGSEFRRMKLDDPNRIGGILGQASLLTVTSYPNRTSIVQRGKWILENLLGSPPPPPPPDVPDLKPGGSTGKASLRAAMEEHRANPVCASCHARMDPLGFALENYDATGMFRGNDNGVPIDPVGKLPDGSTIDGPAGLRKVLLSRRSEFIETFVEKLLTYALGRGIEYSDKPAVRAIVREAARDDYRMTSVIAAVAKSTPFTMRRRPAR